MVEWLKELLWDKESFFGTMRGGMLALGAGLATDLPKMIADVELPPIAKVIGIFCIGLGGKMQSTKKPKAAP